MPLKTVHALVILLSFSWALLVRDMVVAYTPFSWSLAVSLYLGKTVPNEWLQEWRYSPFYLLYIGPEYSLMHTTSRNCSSLTTSSWSPCSPELSFTKLLYLTSSSFIPMYPDAYASESPGKYDGKVLNREAMLLHVASSAVSKPELSSHETTLAEWTSSINCTIADK